MNTSGVRGWDIGTTTPKQCKRWYSPTLVSLNSRLMDLVEAVTRAKKKKKKRLGVVLVI